MLAMLEETYVISDSFVSTAMLHGLVSQAAGRQIISHAQRNNIAQAEAAQILELLDVTNVQAVQLLQNPASLAPGYEIKSLLGSGAMGLVFRAHQVALDRDVALKTMRLGTDGGEADIARIRREAKAIATLQHPNIVSAYDAGIHEGRFFIAIELIEGEDLSSYISRRGSLAEWEAWQIARQVASALAHAEAMGIVHRDVKPGNILLANRDVGADCMGNSPTVKVTDFGLAYRVASENELQMTASGATLGTPAYVAPEQLNDTHVDARADIYALGATIVHMLTGRPPYHECTAIQAIIAKTTGKDKWRKVITDNCHSLASKLLLQMTETKPNNRIGSYPELIRRIDEVLDCLQGNQSENEQFYESGQPREHRESSLGWIKVPLMVVLGVILAIVVFFFATPGRESSERFGPDLAAWHPASLPRPLFNGLSVPLFSQSGRWQPHTSKEGSRVLAGAEGSDLRIPLGDALASQEIVNWRFRVSLQPQEGAVARILLKSAGDRPMAAIVIETQQATVQSLQEGPKPHEVANLKVSNQEETRTIDEPIVWACELSQIDGSLIIRINGQQLGFVKLGDATLDTIVLEAQRGETYFADLDIVQLAYRAE